MLWCWQELRGSNDHISTRISHSASEAQNTGDTRNHILMLMWSSWGPRTESPPVPPGLTELRPRDGQQSQPGPVRNHLAAVLKAVSS